jgi:mannobiose 2-epimerase
MSRCLVDDLLACWYPLVLDRASGGYYTNLSHDWQLLPDQDKMIVTQARHVWTTSEAAAFLPDAEKYIAYSRHGVAFLSDFMWDQEYKGFYQIRNRNGGFSDCHGWKEEKRTCGNACAVHALARYNRLTDDRPALDLAIETFHWLESHAFDKVYGRYARSLTRAGRAIGQAASKKPATVESGEDAIVGAGRATIVGAHECAEEDFNVSIHLLEAYTELYRVWKDRTLKDRLAYLLRMVRDAAATKQGYLRSDDAPDRVSFGHDCRTAFILLEASHALGVDNDSRTLLTAQRLLEHSIANGWDQNGCGFFNGGYYQDDSSRCTITRSLKTWWVQADALNVLLFFSHIFPSDRCYREMLEKQWEYIDAFLIDHRLGGWFEYGRESGPDVLTAPKGHMWKSPHSATRALMNCIALLSDEQTTNDRIRGRRNALLELVAYWKRM